MTTQCVPRTVLIIHLLLGLAWLWTAPSACGVGNDNFADAWVVPSLPYITNSANADATVQAGEPSHHGSTVGHTVWWRWTAPSSGPVQVNTTNSSFASVLAVYTGSALNSLTRIASGRGNHLVNFIAIGGTTYHIALDSRDAGGWGNFAFRVYPGSTPPANDQFANALQLYSTNATVTGATNIGATIELGEPGHAGNTGGKSVWWKWVAPVSGTFQLDTTNSTFDTLLAVYRGASVSNLSLVASNDTPLSFASQVTFSATAGSLYYFAVDGWEARDGEISLHLNQQGGPSGPINDIMASAIAIAGSSFNGNGSYNTNATKEAGEPNHGGNAGGRSVWWVWTAPANGPCHLDTIDSAFNTLLAVYTGAAVSNLTLIASNDDSAYMPPASELTFNATAGVSYYIAVDGFAGASGRIALNLNHTPRYGPPNDDFTGAIPVTGSNYSTINATNAGATKEVGEPNHANQPGGASVWWAWTAPYSGLAIVEVYAASFWSQVGVYTGSSVSNLAPVSSGSGFVVALPFQATSGTVYRIAVDGYAGLTGSFTLTLSPGPPPPVNDNFNDALIVAGPSYATNLNTLAATKEAAEPNHNGSLGGQSVWWKWTPSSSMRAQVSTTNSSFPTVVGIYTGSSLASLTPVASGYGNHLVNFEAAGGTTYRIAVDSSSHSAGGNLRFGLYVAPPSPTNDLFANALLLSGSTVTVSNASSAGAGRETGEPSHAGDVGGKSVWWRWTAPASGLTQVDTIGSSFDTLLAIYTGSSISSLTEIASNDQSGGLSTSKTNFNAISGTTYYIAVDGWHAQGGDIVLRLAGPEAQDIFLLGGNLVFSNAQPHVSFEVMGPAGLSVVVQVNTNLNFADWPSLLTNVLTGGSFYFTDPEPAIGAQKFYRVLGQ